MKHTQLKIVLSIAFSLILIMNVVGTSAALTVEVTDQGWINIYQGSVLGKTDNQGKAAGKDTSTEQAKPVRVEQIKDDVLVKQIGKYQQKEISIEPEKPLAKLKSPFKTQPA